MRTALKKALQRFLEKSTSNRLRHLLLKLLYARKGMAFKGFRAFYKRFYIFHVDEWFIPTELPYWNVVHNQYVTNCREISLAFCTLEPGDVVIDIGAGLGEELIVYASLVGRQGKVICMEPHPQAFSVLNEVVRLNGFQNTEIRNCALYNRDEPMNLVDDGGSYDACHSGKADSRSPSFRVLGKRFDSFMDSIRAEKIKLVKVNIEGAERFLLNDDFLPYFRRVKHFAIACHDFRYQQEGDVFFKTKDAVKGFFSKHGFIIKTQQTGYAFIDDWVYIENRDL